MARIILGSYMVRYPLGGMMSWVLQYLTGFARLGHDVYFVEKAGGHDACFDPTQRAMTNDCTYGTQRVDELLRRFGLGGRWCFVDVAGEYHGLSRQVIEDLFETADLFIDMGTHGAWLEEAAKCWRKILIDGEPAFTQLKMERRAVSKAKPDLYDMYFTTGRNIGSQQSTAPTGGKEWNYLYHPVDETVIEAAVPPQRDAPYTTVMNWRSYEPVEFNGITYRHKDAEFPKFLALPRHASDVRLEAAVAGGAPRKELTDHGWQVRSAHEVTHTFDAFIEYIRSSRGEFAVCKSGYVTSNSGWFSDRSAAYLASGRPVVLQETGFSSHLPTGRGLFAVRSAEEAAAAFDEIESDYRSHASAAREIAREYLSSQKVLSKVLDEVERGVSPHTLKESSPCP